MRGEAIGSPKWIMGASRGPCLPNQDHVDEVTVRLQVLRNEEAILADLLP